MLDIGQQLLQMKEQIDKVEKKDAELKGQLKEQLSRLKKDFNCPSMEEGEKKLDKLQQDLKKKRDVLGKGVAKLQEKMEVVDGNN